MGSPNGKVLGVFNSEYFCQNEHSDSEIKGANFPLAQDTLVFLEVISFLQLS